MDPIATLWKFINATTDAERAEAAADYAGWINKGGFRAPVTFHGNRRLVVGLSARTKRITFLASSVATDHTHAYADLDYRELKRLPS